MNLLVLCTGNSARSILLEAIFNNTSLGRVTAHSAGSNPSGRVHPQALTMIGRLGWDSSAMRSKSWDVFAGPDAPEMDAVITVCDAAARETCPIWRGTPMRSHWGVADLAAAPRHAWEAAFEEVYETLAHRARMFLNLPFETMDRPSLKSALDHIGTLP